MLDSNSIALLLLPRPSFPSILSAYSTQPKPLPLHLTSPHLPPCLNNRRAASIWPACLTRRASMCGSAACRHPSGKGAERGAATHWHACCLYWLNVY